MRNPPPDVIASWPEANFVDPEYQGPQLAIVAITLLVFSFVIVALRIWVRVQMKKRAGWDDWIMVIAMVCKDRYWLVPRFMRLKSGHSLRCLSI